MGMDNVLLFFFFFNVSQNCEWDYFSSIFLIGYSYNIGRFLIFCILVLFLAVSLSYESQSFKSLIGLSRHRKTYEQNQNFSFF